MLIVNSKKFEWIVFNIFLICFKSIRIRDYENKGRNWKIQINKSNDGQINNTKQLREGKERI